MPLSSNSSTPGAHGITRRSFLKLSVVLGGAASLLGQQAAPAFAASDDALGPDAYPSRTVKLCIMSDLHVMAPSLWADNAAYAKAENSDRKMFRESLGILEKALSDVVEAKPDLVLVPGDLTKDGELVGHRLVHEKFEAARAALQDAGVDTRFFVINGNHDLNNHNGLDFTKLNADGTAQFAEFTTPTVYKRDVWAEYGYTGTTVYDADGTDDGSLSYAVRPFKGLTLIVVDSCKYNEPDPGDGQGLAQTTSGHISDDLLTWVLAQTRNGRQNGDLVLVMQHHGVVPHFNDEPTIMGEYLVDEYDKIAQAYAEAGVSAVLTGHMHANDIAKAEYGDAALYDIETGSLVTYPSYMRTAELSFAHDDATVTASLSVDVHELGTVSFDGCGLDGTTSASDGDADITSYGKKRTLTLDSVQTMLGTMMVDPLFEQAAQTGSKQLAASLGTSLLGQDITVDTLDPALWSALKGVLSADADSGYKFSFSVGSTQMTFSVYYDTATDHINIDSYSEAEGASEAILLSLTEEQQEGAAEVLDQMASVPQTFATSTTYFFITQDSFTTFIDKLFATLDANVLGDTAGAMAVVNAAVKLLLDAHVDDESHTVLELVNYCYQDHLLGCETCDEWVEEALAGIQGSGLLNNVVGGAVNDLLKDGSVSSLAASITFDLGDLLQTPSGLGGMIGKLALAYIKGQYNDLGDLLGLLGNVDLGSMAAGIIPSSVTDLVYSALYTLSHDDNIADDHAYALSATMTDPDYQPSGDGNGPGTGDGNGTGDGSGAGTGSGSGAGGGSGSTGSGSGNNAGAGAGSSDGESNAVTSTSPSRLAQTGDPLTPAAAAAVAAGVGAVAVGAGAVTAGARRGMAASASHRADETGGDFQA